MMGIILLILFAIGMVCIALVARKSYTGDGDIAGFGVILCFIVIIAPIPSVFQHAGDLGTVRAQHERIKVYEERVSELKAIIKQTGGIHKQDNVLYANKDMPISSVVEQLAVATSDLAVMRDEKAAAIVSIEKRKAGIFSFVVVLMGDVHPND